MDKYTKFILSIIAVVAGLNLFKASISLLAFSTILTSETNQAFPKAWETYWISSELTN